MGNRRSKYRPRSCKRFDPRLDVRARRRGQPPKRLVSNGAGLGLVALTGIFIGGLVLSYWSHQQVPLEYPVDAAATSVEAVAPSPNKRGSSISAAGHTNISVRIRHCGAMRRTCVVDGDTFWLEGDKIRIADIDTPEVSRPQCASEKALGDRATNRLISLLNEGPFELSSTGNRDVDQYGRKLRVVTRNGRSLGDQLVSEGLARTWTGRREPWC